MQNAVTTIAEFKYGGTIYQIVVMQLDRDSRCYVDINTYGDGLRFKPRALHDTNRPSYAIMDTVRGILNWLDAES